MPDAGTHESLLHGLHLVLPNEPLNNDIIVMRSILQDNHKKLVVQYEENFADVCALQSILNDELLPHVAQELALSDVDYAWTKGWVSDTGKCTCYPQSRDRQFNACGQLQPPFSVSSG
jgi:retinaldehyde-binding protein 1